MKFDVAIFCRKASRAHGSLIWARYTAISNDIVIAGEIGFFATEDNSSETNAKSLLIIPGRLILLTINFHLLTRISHVTYFSLIIHRDSLTRQSAR